MDSTLNSQQQAAAQHRDSHLLVVAGAGSGKTRTLVSRVVSLLNDGADPSRVLLLTFTRRAAAEMIGRVASACGEGVESSQRLAAQIWGGTFHATANRLLRHYGSAAGLPDGFTVLDHSDAIDLFGLVRMEAGFGEGAKRFPRPDTIAAVYSKVVNSQAPLEDVLAKDFPWVAEHRDELRELFTAYTAQKRTSHVLDYDDLLLYWRGLTTSPIGEALRCLFDHILVDEYQDTNPIQADIIKGMCGYDTQVCVVGDDAQAIYGFRSATVANMWSFSDDFPGTRLITLEQNYRSTSPILELANALLEQNTGDEQATPSGADNSSPSSSGPTVGFSKSLWTDKTGGLRPSLITSYDETEQSTVVADRILDARERGLDLKQQAVLFRAGHHSDGLELELVRRNIPYVKYGGLKYLEAAHIKDLLSLLRILENPEDRPAWRRVLLSLDGIGPATVRRLMDELRVGKPKSDAVARFVDGIGRMPASAAEQAAELRKALLACRIDQPPAEQIDRLKQYCRMIFPLRYENAEARLADIDQLAVTARQYSERSRFLVELTLDPPERTGDLAGPPHLDDDWLTLSTIHSAKGSEWRAVYVIHAADGNIPSDMAISDADGLAEELRLLYVAVTRAREELTITFPLRYHVHPTIQRDRHHFAQLCRFVEPLRPLFDEQDLNLTTPDHDQAVRPQQANLGVAEEVDSLLQSLWS